MKTPVRCLAAALFCLFALPVSAAEKAKRTCRLLIPFPPSKEVPETMFLFDGTNTREVKVPTKNFSPLYDLPEGDLTLRLLPEAPAEGVIPDEKNSLSLAFPASVQHAYILLLAGKKKDDPPRLQLIKANEEGFQAGEMMWFNLSPYEVSGEIGTRQLDLKAQGRQIVKSPAEGFAQYRVSLKYLPQGAKRPAPLSSSMWRHKPTARSIVFVVMSPRNKMPQIMSFFDTRDVPEKEE
ncbi:MAG: hypothetical protein ACQKBY_03040 [Verrucomicrobiales bacterium]